MYVQCKSFLFIFIETACLVNKTFPDWILNFQGHYIVTTVLCYVSDLLVGLVLTLIFISYNCNCICTVWIESFISLPYIHFWIRAPQTTVVWVPNWVRKRWEWDLCCWARWETDWPKRGMRWCGSGNDEDCLLGERSCIHHNHIWNEGRKVKI